ncbi:MAG: 3-oxoacyl-ACP reductase family protein [Nostoc sp. DedQUE08]|uniref:3-oxoacyl-ACP reductase family protein n=1 Tax=unclassified Nostoc TaxID=2593658 RepID=UPI002AD53414|nr:MULTISPECIES: 3-oxoacyl-ACP reductase family protein [unclassified Nostoc]MDZ8031886.1 3-oxoacyl-ACP reductase family protein [Nostoc sp. DedSLP04]MDZ8067814.1 3-oxoacyl-ACP reductase family protein [Nostoc sp. DedQUE08]
MSNKKLTGKVALVTGGSRGLGAAIAKRLAQDGAAVALTYTSSPQKADEVVQAIETAGGQALAIRADSANAEAVKNAVTETVKAFGRLDILVNNAGIATLATIDEFSLDDFDRIIAVNIKGVFVATQEAVRHIGEGGRIIMIGSVNSDIMPFAGGSVYALTKGAIASFTRGLARDLGPRNITVNNIQPGPVDTDMNPAEGSFADTMRSMTALQRYGRSEEVADMVSYLASAEAGFVTGASLNIDGGFTA